MKLNIAQVIGLNTDQKAAQVISSQRNGDGTFLAVLNLSSDDAFTKGRQILSELSDFYFDFEGLAADKVKATFEKAKEKFPTEEYSLLTAAISGKVLYLISKGEVEVYLRRAEKLSPLLSVGAPSQLISGFLEEGDRILFSTKSLITFLGEDLEKSLRLPLEEFEEEITDRIGVSNLENQGFAALAVEVEVEKTEQAGEGLGVGEIPSLQDAPSGPSESYYADTSQKQSGIIIKQTAVKILQLLASVRKYFPGSGKGRLILAVVLIVVLGLGVGFKVKSAKDAEKQIAFTRALQTAKDDFNEARGLASLNPLEAKVKLDSAKARVSEALALNPKNAEGLDLQKQIDAESGSILQQSSISEFPLFLDLDLVKKNFRAQNLTLSGGKILLLDPAVKTLVSIELAKKSNQILAGSEQLGEARRSSLNGALAFVYSEDKGILRVDTQNQKVTGVSKSDSKIGQVIDIAGFAGNIYLLDSEKNQIWKYLATSDGYSDKREYLTKDTTADFSNSLRMQIESSIYVLKSGGEILRFTKGEKDNFGLEGLDKGVKDPKSFFVSSETDNLYLLDSGNSRLLILTKAGKFKGQMGGEKFAQASDLVVDEKAKKVYLLEGSKIYTADLK